MSLGSRAINCRPATASTKLTASYFDEEVDDCNYYKAESVSRWYRYYSRKPYDLVKHAALGDLWCWGLDHHQNLLTGPKQELREANPSLRIHFRGGTYRVCWSKIASTCNLNLCNRHLETVTFTKATALWKLMSRSWRPMPLCSSDSPL